MRDLSMHVLDIAQNSIKAGASLVEISFVWKETMLTLLIKDDGCGMSEEFLKKVLDPFTTTRTTRKVGLGLAMLEQSVQMSGGAFDIQSTKGVGTTVKAVFDTAHIDCLPMGDMCDTLFSLAFLNPDTPEFFYTAHKGDQQVTFDTREIRNALGPDIPFTQNDVALWIQESIKESFQPILEVY